MKPKFSKRRNEGLTRADVIALLVIAVIIISLVIFPMLAAADRSAQQLNCLSNLKQISLAIRIWDGDDDTNTPAAAMNEMRTELLVKGNVAGWFQAASNILYTPKILICPADIDHSVAATNFQDDFNNSHISYFVSPDANEMYPLTILSGDDNLAISNIPVKSGLLYLATNAPVAWTAARHRHSGNIAFADGSETEVSDSRLQQSLVLATNGTPFTTNRLVIP